MIPYSDGKKEAAMNWAVQQGFVQRTIDRDGIVKYTLTFLGQQRIAFEKIFNR